MANKNQGGQLNPNYRSGLYAPHNCVDCNTPISAGHKRCSSCCKLRRNLSPATITKLQIRSKGKNNPMYGKVTHGKYGTYKNIYMRSTWEIKFAKWLDKQNISWKYEPKTFKLGVTSYTPDFYLPKQRLYIEIKGFWREDAILKVELFYRLYPTIKLNIYEKHDLVQLGVL
jgi:hypothetical protein